MPSAQISMSVLSRLGLVEDDVLLGDQIGDFGVIDEACLVLGRCFPFGRVTGRQQGLHVVEP